MAPIVSRYLKNRRIFAVFDRGITFNVQAEQIPVARSCIKLNDGERLKDGLYPIVVDWQCDGGELDAIYNFAMQSDVYLRRNGLAQLTIESDLLRRDRGFLDTLGDTYHQCGGMRMSASPATGVVDPDGRVWGVGNRPSSTSVLKPRELHVDWIGDGGAAIGTFDALMEKVAIPNSSVRLSRLGFGCARMFGGPETRASTRLIEAALKQGISHFDTAPSYGSEGLLGEVLAGVRDITIATKVGVPRAADSLSAAKRVIGPLYRSTLRPLLARVPTLKASLLRRRGHANVSPRIEKRRVSRDEVLRELDESLRRLRRTAIDVYLIHEPDAIELTDDLRDIFLSLHRSGTIKAFGLAFGGVPKPIAFGHVVQCRYDTDSLAVAYAGALRIYHGVIRLGMQSRGQAISPQNPPEMVRDALASHPNAAVIVSASTPRQLSNISIWDGDVRK